MTKAELKAKMDEFILSKSAFNYDEWYSTERVLYGEPIQEFAKFIDIEIEIPDDEK